MASDSMRIHTWYSFLFLGISDTCKCTTSTNTALLCILPTENLLIQLVAEITRWYPTNSAKRIYSYRTIKVSNSSDSRNTNTWEIHLCLPQPMTTTSIIFCFHVWQSCWVRYLFVTSYGFALGITCGSRSSLQVRGASQPKSVYKLPAKIQLLLSRRQGWIFNYLGMISDPYPLVWTSIFYHGDPNLHYSNLEWEACRQWGSNRWSVCDDDTYQVW